MKEKLLLLHNHNFVRKFYAYLIIGIIGVVVDSFFTNVLFHYVFSPIFHPESALETNTYKTISANIGAVSGIINNFLINDFVVYKIKNGKRNVALRFIKYVLAVFIGTFIIGKILVLNIFNHYGAPLWFANLAAIAIGMFINYPINYFWTWRAKNSGVVPAQS